MQIIHLSKSMIHLTWVDKKMFKLIKFPFLHFIKPNLINTILSWGISSWLGSLFWIKTLQFILMLLLMSCCRWTGCSVVREKHWSVIGMFCKQTFTWHSTVKKVTAMLSLQNKIEIYILQSLSNTETRTSSWRA